MSGWGGFVVDVTGQEDGIRPLLFAEVEDLAEDVFLVLQHGKIVDPFSQVEVSKVEKFQGRLPSRLFDPVEFGSGLGIDQDGGKIIVIDHAGLGPLGFVDILFLGVVHADLPFIALGGMASGQPGGCFQVLFFRLHTGGEAEDDMGPGDGLGMEENIFFIGQLEG